MTQDRGLTIVLLMYINSLNFYFYIYTIYFPLAQCVICDFTCSLMKYG